MIHHRFHHPSRFVEASADHTYRLEKTGPSTVVPHWRSNHVQKMAQVTSSSDLIRHIDLPHGLPVECVSSGYVSTVATALDQQLSWS